MSNRQFQKIRHFFIPDCDELSLFTMSFTCILLIATNVGAKWKSYNISFSNFDFGSFVICLLFVSGLILCFYHAFSNRPKKLIEKKLMIFFAVIVNGFSGIWGGTYLLLHGQRFLNLFPIWNIVNGVLLIGMLRAGALNEDNIADDNVSFTDLVVGSTVVCIVFFFCNFIFV